MKPEQFLLAQNMEFLLTIPPGSNLAKLLSFCLATKVRSNVSRCETFANICKLMEKPSNLAYWTQEIMGLDLDYSSEEWQTLGDMELTNPADFMNQVWSKLESLNL